MADNYYYGTGRRKESIARVRLFPGDGTITVNEKPPLQYFGRRILEMVVQQPLKVTDSLKRFSISAKVTGGGSSGQAGAVSHGIARALCQADQAMATTYLTQEVRLLRQRTPPWATLAPDGSRRAGRDCGRH